MKPNNIKIFVFIGFLIFFHCISFAESKIYSTEQVISAPLIDGILDDDAWNMVEWGSDFVQYEPYAGKPASQKTAFKVLYNSNYLYVAIRAFDTAADSIVRRIARRDQLDGDFVGIQFDSYHDLKILNHRDK